MSVQVFLRDLSNVMLLDKDQLDPDGFSSAETKSKKNESNKSEYCDDDCFNKFYDKLTERKDDKVSHAN